MDQRRLNPNYKPEYKKIKKLFQKDEKKKKTIQTIIQTTIQHDLDYKVYCDRVNKTIHNSYNHIKLIHDYKHVVTNYVLDRRLWKTCEKRKHQRFFEQSRPRFGIGSIVDVLYYGKKHAAIIVNYKNESLKLSVKCFTDMDNKTVIKSRIILDQTVNRLDMQYISDIQSVFALVRHIDPNEYTSDLYVGRIITVLDVPLIIMISHNAIVGLPLEKLSIEHYCTIKELYFKYNENAYTIFIQILLRSYDESVFVPLDLEKYIEPPVLHITRENKQTALQDKEAWMKLESSKWKLNSIQHYTECAKWKKHAEALDSIHATQFPRGLECAVCLQIKPPVLVPFVCKCNKGYSICRKCLHTTSTQCIICKTRKKNKIKNGLDLTKTTHLQRHINIVVKSIEKFYGWPNVHLLSCDKHIHCGFTTNSIMCKYAHDRKKRSAPNY